MLIIPLKIHITGRVKTADIITVVKPILSIGIKIDNINNINVNTAKLPNKNRIIIMNAKFETKYIAAINRNQEIIKIITITNKSVLFDRFLSPEINLIIYILNSVIFKISYIYYVEK